MCCVSIPLPPSPRVSSLWCPVCFHIQMTQWKINIDTSLISDIDMAQILLKKPQLGDWKDDSARGTLLAQITWVKFSEPTLGSWVILVPEDAIPSSFCSYGHFYSCTHIHKRRDSWTHTLKLYIFKKPILYLNPDKGRNKLIWMILATKKYVEFKKNENWVQTF